MYHDLQFLRRVLSDFFSTLLGLCYEGITETLANQKVSTVSIPFVKDIIEIPGVSEIGLYKYNTGEIEPFETSLGVKAITSAKPKTPHQINLEKLRFILAAHFSESELAELCSRIDLNYNNVLGGDKNEKVEEIIAYTEKVGLTMKLLQDAFQLSRRKQ